MPVPIQNRPKQSLQVFLPLTIIGLIILSLWRLQPLSQEVGEFSTEAAMKHLRFIASQTRPVGLPHHQAVRDYLLNEFEKLGYSVQTQDVKGPIRLSNVLARKPGDISENKAVMLAAHYDSVRWGPGAGDDGAAVSALLEVARVMAKNSYRNDIIFLITDGEELGLSGAVQFMERHPWASEIGVVLNFDARGTSGASIMYETSDNNAWLIKQFAQSDPHPVCGSLTQEVYRLMPNKTDFTIFQRKIPGLNFAFIGGYANYHTANDDLAHLDPASLRHHGIQALAMAEKLAEMNLNEIPSSGNAVYFDVLSFFIVRYPMRWVSIISIVVAAFAMTVIYAGIKAKQIQFWKVCTSLGLLIINIAAVSGISWSILWSLRGIRLGPHADLVITGFALLASAITIAVIFGVPILTSKDMAAAGLIAWTIGALATGNTLQGVSYLIVWPLLFAAIGLGCSIALTSDQMRIPRSVILILSALPTTLLLPGVIYLAFLALKVVAAPKLTIPIVLALWLFPLQIRSTPPLLPQPAEAA